MGHYDDYYEADYAEARKKAQQLRNEEIPKIIDQLDNVRNTLFIFQGEIDKSKRMQDDIEYMILALQGQIE